jgi:transposase
MTRLSVAREENLVKDSSLDDDEWALLASFLIETGPKRGRPPRDHRRVLDGVLWIAQTNSPWRDLPQDYGNWSSVYRQFLRWTRLGLWEQMIAAAVAADDTPSPREKRAGARGAPPLAKRLAAVRALATRRRAPIAATCDPRQFADAAR